MGMYLDLDDVAGQSPLAITELAALRGTIERLLKIEDAARNLVLQKGRHNTDVAYKRLAALVEIKAATAPGYWPDAVTSGSTDRN